MKIKLVAAFKNQLVVAVIVVGAIVTAIPVFICGLIRVLWNAFASWARPRKPAIAEIIWRLAEAAEARIVGRAGKQNEK